MSYIIIAHRSGDSIFGAAEAPLKYSGVVRHFDTVEQARSEADRLNRRTHSMNVWYTVQGAADDPR